MPILITLFLAYIMIVIGLSITESVVKSMLHKSHTKKRIKIKRPNFIKKS